MIDDDDVISNIKSVVLFPATTNKIQNSLFRGRELDTEFIVSGARIGRGGTPAWSVTPKRSVPHYPFGEN